MDRILDTVKNEDCRKGLNTGYNQEKKNLYSKDSRSDRENRFEKRQEGKKEEDKSRHKFNYRKIKENRIR